MIKAHIHDFAFLDGGEGVYCLDADCDFVLSGDNLLSVLKSICRREDWREGEGDGEAND